MLGAGGVTAALLVLPRLRRRLSVDALTVGGAVVFAVATFGGVAVASSLAAALPGLFLGGAASMLTLSSLQASAQTVLPDWVRGRGLAIVQLVFQAGMAGGAVLWGAIASAQGVTVAMLAAGATLILLTLGSVALGARLGEVAGLDLRPATGWAGSGSAADIPCAAHASDADGQVRCRRTSRNRRRPARPGPRTARILGVDATAR